MVKFKKKLLCQKGAIDKVLVTLFLMLVSIVLLFSIEQWYTQQQDRTSQEASETIKRSLE